MKEKRTKRRVLRFAAVALSLLASFAGNAVESDPVLVRGKANVCLWQTAGGTTTLSWRWPDGATEAVVSVSARVAKTTVVDAATVSRKGSEAWGELANAIPTATGEELYSAIVSFGGSEKTFSATVASIPATFTLVQTNVKEWKNVADPRLLYLSETSSFAATPGNGEAVALSAADAPGFSVFDPKSLGTYYGDFTLAADGCSADLSRQAKGLVLIVR